MEGFDIYKNSRFIDSITPNIINLYNNYCTVISISNSKYMKNWSCKSVINTKTVINYGITFLIVFLSIFRIHVFSN